MSRPCSQRVLHGLLRRHIGLNHHNHHPFPTPSPQCSTSTSSSFAAYGNCTLSRFSPSPGHAPLHSLLRSSPKFFSSSATRLPRTIPKRGGDNYGTGSVRLLSLKSPNLNGGFAKKVFNKPAAAVSSAFSRYSEAVGLQIEAFFKRNYLFLLGAGGVVVCGVLWKIMFGIANAFIGLSEGMAKYGFLALSSAIVTFAVSL